MQTDQLWNEIRNLKGRRLKTLAQHRTFDVVDVTEHVVIVLPHATRKERPIQRQGIENAHRHLTVTGRLTLTEIENEFAPRNPVYVAAMLAELPGVRVRLNPISLFYGE